MHPPIHTLTLIHTFDLESTSKATNRAHHTATAFPVEMFGTFSIYILHVDYMYLNWKCRLYLPNSSVLDFAVGLLINQSVK